MKISNKMTKAALAALLAGAPFVQSIQAFAKEKESEPEVEEFGFPEEYNEDCWGSSYTYDEEDYSFLNDYETLTDKEKQQVSETLGKIYDLYDQMVECVDDKGNVVDQKKLDELEKEEKELWDSIADIQKKMDKEDVEKSQAYLKEFVEKTPYLDENQKKEYIDIIGQIFDLGKEIDSLVDDDYNVTDQDKFDSIVEKLNTLLESLGVMDEKITNGEIEDSKDLTEDEKKTLIDAYAKLDELYEKEDACFDKQGNLIDEKKYDELCEEEEKILDSIWDLEMKLYGVEQTEL